MTDDRVCPLEHTDPQAAGRTSAICDLHSKWVYDAVDKFATLETDLDELIEAKTARHDTAPLTGNPEKALPIDIRAADLRVDVKALLVSWTRLIAEERLVDLPADTMRALSGFLRKHHDWALAQPWADDYAGEILELGSKAHSLFNPRGTKQWTNSSLMRCVQLDDVDMSRCPGSMWAILMPEGDDIPGSLVCDTCDFTEDSRSWLLGIGRRIHTEAA